MKPTSPPGSSHMDLASILSRLWEIAKNNKNMQFFDFFLYGRWEDLDRWKWVVIDVGVIPDTSASHSENLFFLDIFRLYFIERVDSGRVV